MKKYIIIFVIIALLGILYWVWKIRNQATIFRIDRATETIYIRIGFKDHELKKGMEISAGNKSYELSSFGTFSINENGKNIKTTSISKLTTGPI